MSVHLSFVGKLSSVSVERRAEIGEQRLESRDWRAEIGEWKFFDFEK
jgi:hypothetical protein